MDITDSDTPGADPGVLECQSGRPAHRSLPSRPRLGPLWLGPIKCFQCELRLQLAFVPVCWVPEVSGRRLAGQRVITRFWSGTPINIYMGGCSELLYGKCRELRQPGSARSRNREPLRGEEVHFTWLNSAAFVAPPLGTVGDVRRNAFRGPGINNWDMSLFKNINFSESRYLQIRLETFNTF